MPLSRSIAARRCTLLLAIVATLPPATAAEPVPSRRAVAEHRADLKSLRGRIGQLTKEIAADEASRAEAADLLQNSDLAISRLQRELRQLAGERAAVLATRDQLQTQTTALAGRLDRQHEGLSAALRARHRLDLSGATGSTDSPQRLMRRHLAAAAVAHAGLIANTADDLDRKARSAQAAERRAQALADIETRQQRRQRELVAQREQRQKLMHKISARLEDQRRQVATLRQDERRLSQLIERLARVLAARSKPKRPAHPEPATAPPRQTAGPGAGPRKLPIALLSPIEGGSGRRQAKGLFFGVPAGKEVRAAAAGEVVFADWLRGFGNLLIIDHGGEVLTIYGYNEALLRQVGDAVIRGDVVATAGDSGGRGETGLYFEMRHEGTAIDPTRWLARQ